MTAKIEELAEQIFGSVKIYLDKQLSNLTSKFENGDFKGEKGEQGLQGEKGEQGLQGEKGEQGLQGEKGEQGLQGEKGEQGLQGEKGEQGLQGEKGEQGLQGEKGEQGLQGEKGEQGLQGEKGEQGLQGEKGEQGLQGEKGEQGLQGEKGEQGLQGEKGEQGLQGEKGEQGLQGEKGEQGLQGEKGEQGLQGEKGEQGLQGEKGESIEIKDVQLFLESKFSEWALSFEQRAQKLFLDTIEKMPKPKDGADGFSLEDFDIEQKDEKTLVFKFKSVNKELSKEFSFPVVVYKGVWKDGTYSKNESVTRDGCLWICRVEKTTSKPSENVTDWQLAVKKGRDGRDGLKGEKGERGASGKDLTFSKGDVS